MIFDILSRQYSFLFQVDELVNHTMKYLPVIGFLLLWSSGLFGQDTLVSFPLYNDSMEVDEHMLWVDRTMVSTKLAFSRLVRPR